MWTLGWGSLRQSLKARSWKKKKGEAGENLDPHCQKKREKKSDEWIKQIPKLRMGGGELKLILRQISTNIQIKLFNISFLNQID